jgi:A/G-specific adenine glycosylase
VGADPPTAECAKIERTMLTGRERTSFRKRLLAWFRQYQRDLPWRRTRDPYRIWLSEIMLQQTRVAAVIPYYERFLERIPTIEALAEVPQEDVLRLWSGLGYYTRARNLQRAAQQIVSKHRGLFPSDPREVLALPGIGNYTAAAILSIAFDEKHAVLDGNVARVLARLGAIRGDPRTGNRWQELQTLADGLLDPNSPGDWNQAMMELGATMCTPKSPRCLLCPVGQFCGARNLGLADVIPEKRKKRSEVKVTLAIAVLCDSRGRVLLLPPPLRDPGTKHDEVTILVSKMWHFPTVIVDGTPDEELARSLRTLSPSLASLAEREIAPLSRVRHTVTYRNITVQPFRIRLRQLPKIRGAKGVPLRQVVEPSVLAISNLTRKVARAALAAETVTSS